MSIRRRHTFFIQFDDPNAIEKFDFSQENASVLYSHFTSPREDKITVPYNLIASNSKLLSLLDSIDKLQVKWSRDVPFDHNYPAFIVREPGLHVEIVPKKSVSIDVENFSALLKTFFNVEFTGKKQFVNGFQWKSIYAPLDTLQPLSEALQNTLCEKSNTLCTFQLAELTYADSFSLTYGSLPSNARPINQESDLVFEVFWSNRTSIASDLDLTTSSISKLYPNEKVEVGLLAVHPEYTTKNSIWGLAGFSRDLDLNKTEKLLFQYTTKHRNTESSYYVDFVRPTGLHPKHEIHMSNVRVPQRGCALFAKYTFDKSLFLDKYQLKDLAEATPNRPPIGRLFGVWGETDLEAPVWAVGGWGSEALVQIYTATASDKLDLDFELPTHSRYEVPQQNASLVHEYQPWPVVFWACQSVSDKDGELEAKIPASIETKSIGYESIFPNDTVFYYFNPTIPNHFTSSHLQSEFDIPVAPFSSYSTVQVVSVVVIFTCFFYLLYEILRSFLGYNKPPTVDTNKKNS